MSTTYRQEGISGRDVEAEVERRIARIDAVEDVPHFQKKSDERKSVIAGVETLSSVVDNVHYNLPKLGLAAMVEDTVGREVTAHGPKPGFVASKEPDDDEDVTDAPNVKAAHAASDKRTADRWKDTPSPMVRKRMANSDRRSRQ